MITTEILRAWFSENAIRAFPLDEAATRIDDDNERALPDALLVGMELMIPSPMAVTDGGTGLETPLHIPYLSRVVISEAELSVTVAAGGVDVARAVIDTGSLSNDDPRGFALASLETGDPDYDGVGGKIFFGPPAGFLGQGGVYTFSGPPQTGISLDCVHSYPEHLRALLIGGERLTVYVVLEEGPNVSLDYNPDTGTVTVSYMPDPADGILNREDLIDAITDRFGRPVCSINGIPPDAEGDFEVLTASGGCVAIDHVDHGIVISNPCASPCCDKTVMDTLMADIQGLNARHARLHSYLLAATTAVNTLQNELAILKTSMK